MSHRHFDDTGHDITGLYAPSTSNTSYQISSSNPSVTFMQGNPQYPMYQPLPTGNNQVPGNYQYTQQVIVPVPFLIEGEQSSLKKTSNEYKNEKRQSNELDYFLNRSNKTKERKYKSRSRSRSLGEVSDSPVRRLRSRSRSKEKLFSDPFRKEKLKSNEKSSRPENPFRKRKSKSLSPGRLSENLLHKEKGKSHFRERLEENPFRKRRSDFNKISDYLSDKPKRRKTSPVPLRSHRRSRSIDRKKDRASDWQQGRQLGSQKDAYRERHRNTRKRSKSPFVDQNKKDRSRNPRDISKDARDLSRHSREGSMYSRDRFKHSKDRSGIRKGRSSGGDPDLNEQYEKGHWSTGDSSEIASYVNDDEIYHRKDKYDKEIDQGERYDLESFEYDMRIEEHIKKSRQSYSPLSDETIDSRSGGIGLRIHINNRGRWIENEIETGSDSARKTVLMEDGIVIGSSNDRRERKSDIDQPHNPSKTKYLKDGVEVFYEGHSAVRKKSWDASFDMEDISDSESFDSQKDFMAYNSTSPQHIELKNSSVWSGNVSYADDNSFDQSNTSNTVYDRLNVQNICIDYNLDKQACGKFCRYLHVCKFFILGVCKYGNSCKKNHDVLGPQPFELLRKQNPRLLRTQFIKDKVRDILFSRFNRNKGRHKLILPGTTVDIERRSPSVESIKSEESAESIDSFDARYYREGADVKKIKNKQKQKNQLDLPTSEESNTKLKEEIDLNKGNEYTKGLLKSEKTLNEMEEIKAESQDSQVNIQQTMPSNGNVKSDEKNSEHGKEAQIKAQNETKKEVKSDSDKKTCAQIENNSGEKSDTKFKTATNRSSDEKEISDSIECIKDGCIDTKKDVEMDSLSPVSIENVESWDELDKYERISDCCMSDGEKAEIVMDEDLESVSSNECCDDDKKTVEFGPGMIHKVAVPIGMNDPLVFNKLKSADDSKSDTQTSCGIPKTAQIADPIDQPILFPPPVNFNIPPPVLPARFPQLPQSSPLSRRPFFQIATTQNESNVNVPPRYRMNCHAQPFHSGIQPANLIAANSGPAPLIPDVGSLMPGLRPMMPFAQEMVPNVVQSQNPPANHLPAPEIMKEVIETLSQKKEREKKEAEAKKSAEVATETKRKNVKRVDTDINEPMKKLWQFPHKSLINMSIIEFVTETEAYKDEMVAEIVKLLITINLPYVTLKKLMSVIKEKVQINIRTPVDLRKILELYPDNFQIVETVDSDDDSDDDEVKKNVQIKPRLKLGFCSKHGYLPFYLGKCDCKQLHLCKFHFLSECPNMNCKFGHKLKTEHNINTLRYHRLHRMTGEEIMEFLRDVDSRNVETVPGVCKFYNSNMSKESGCYKGDVTDYQDICHNLHICFYHVKGKCLVKDCNKSHSIRATQPFSLLKKYGLDPDVFGEEKIMNLIALKTIDVKKRKEEKAEKFQMSKQSNQDISQKTGVVHDKPMIGNQTSDENKIACQRNKPSVKFPSICKFFNNPSGCKKKDWGATGYCLFLHVCQKYVNGLCKIGERCKRSHTFFSGEPAALITRYGIDLTRLSEQEILDTLTENKNALTELPMIGDDEDSPGDGGKEPIRKGQSTGITGSGQTTTDVETSQRVGQTTTHEFSSHNIDEVLQHIMRVRGNSKQ